MLLSGRAARIREADYTAGWILSESPIHSLSQIGLIQAPLRRMMLSSSASGRAFSEPTVNAAVSPSSIVLG